MNATRSASNAVKHGLTSRSFVPDHARDFVEEIRQDLAAIHDPKTGDEQRLVAELAVALWQNHEHDRRFYERMAYEESIADTVFADQAQAKLQDQLAGLKASPMHYRWRLTETYLGSLHLQNVLQAAIATLKENLPLSFQQITDCINATGHDWRLDTLTWQGGRLMGLHLTLVEHPETEIAHWVAQSQPLSEERANTLAQHHHAQAPSAEAARRALLSELDDNLRQISARIEPLQQEYDHRRGLFKSANAGYGLDDPRTVKAAMLALRYRTASFNRSDRIRKELEKRKNERLNNTPPSVYTHRLPASPIKNPPPVNLSQTKQSEGFTDILKPPPPTTTPRLRNETAPSPTQPFQPLVLAHPRRKFGPRPISNHKAQLARLAKQTSQGR